MQKAMTKEERLILGIYEKAEAESGDPQEEISLNAVIEALGFKEKAVKAMMNLLAQANFVRKDGGFVRLTDRGVELARSLLDG